MQHNELFTFIDPIAEGDLIRAKIKLDPMHPVFKGHFPGQPVLPGVVMVEIVKQLLEIQIKKQTRLVKASDIKFLSLIIPRQDRLIQIVLRISFLDGLINVNAQLLDNADLLFKFKGTFQGKL